MLQWAYDLTPGAYDALLARAGWWLLSSAGCHPMAFVGMRLTMTRRACACVAGLLGTDYSTGQMSNDLRRLRLKGLIERVDGTNTYHLTGDGLRIAIFYTKIHDRMVIPLTAANQPPAHPIGLRNALTVIDTPIDNYRTRARLPTAA